MCNRLRKYEFQGVQKAMMSSEDVRDYFRQEEVHFVLFYCPVPKQLKV